MDVRDVVCEVSRKDAEARPDLEHDVGRLDPGERPCDVEDVVVDEEVLTEGLLGDDGHSSKAAAAFASI